MNDITLIEHLSVDSLTEALQDAGYRVNRSEQNGVVQLLSASQESATRCASAIRQRRRRATSTSLQLRPARAGRIARRADRALESQPALRPPVAAGRVPGDGNGRDRRRRRQPANLRSHIELWDRLLQEFIAYLRDYSRLAAEQQGMAQDAGQPVDGEA